MLEYLVPLALAPPIFLSRSLDWTGSMSALFMAYIIILTQDLYWLLLVVLLFLMAIVATKYKYRQKKLYNLDQKMRSAKNVMANGGVAMLMAILGGPAAFFGFAGSVAAAAADTLSSELGVLSRQEPRLITTMKRVAKGTNGGVTVFGTAVGMLGALVIACVAYIYMPSLKLFTATLVAAFIGCNADSIFGALVENKGIVGNSSTNLVATTAGAITGLLLYLV